MSGIAHTGTNVDAVEAAGKASKIAWTRAGRDRRSGKPAECHAIDKRVFLIETLHQGQQPERLHSKAEYMAWVGGVWIDAGFLIDDEKASALEQIAPDKRLPQRVRHRTFTAAKRWRRAHGDPC